jgi:hypothetical protein
MRHRCPSCSQLSRSSTSRVSKSCERPTLANLSSTDLAEPWVYPYTDFGEGRGKLPRPILRAVIGVGTSSDSPTFSAIVDTGGPVTVVAQEVIHSGGDPVDTGSSMFLRLAGSASEVTFVRIDVGSQAAGRTFDGTRDSVAQLGGSPHALATPRNRCDARPGRIPRQLPSHVRPGGFVLEPADVFKRRYPTLTAGDTEP